jgi:hypothetical protein
MASIEMSSPCRSRSSSALRGCPPLDRDGGVEVGELADLQPAAG